MRLRPRPSTIPLGALLGPDALEVSPRRIKTGGGWCETLAVSGYPREVAPGWLTPLLSYPGPIDVALHVEPVANDLAADRLKRQRARFESTLRVGAGKGRIANPEIEAAAADAKQMMSDLATGEGRLFRVGLYITVRAFSERALEREIGKVRTLCASLLMDTHPVIFRAAQGWATTLPLGTDLIRLRRTFDTAALANCFPFASSEIDNSGGILYGKNAATGGAVFVDRFKLENYNQVVLAHSGKGKSYFAKLQILRSLCHGVEVLVVDPENEYKRLSRAVGGTLVRLGADADRLNPLDLADEGQSDAIIRQALFVHGLIEALVGSLPPIDRSSLDRAILGAYEQAGVTSDPRSHGRPAPLLGDVASILRTDGATELARRLEPFITGSHRGLFDQPTTVKAEGHLTVFSLRDVPQELKGAATMMALEKIWSRVCRGELKRRIVVVDEAWLLLQSEAGGRFLERLARSARKYWCGLTTITQDVRDAVSTALGRTVVTNAAMQVLFGQHPQGLEALAGAFSLSQGERSYLASCPPGHGLLCVGSERATLKVISSEYEHELVTTDPAELAGQGVDQR
ncbi:MAG: ATP-binding protein [Actinomycetota bacterium]